MPSVRCRQATTPEGWPAAGKPEILAGLEETSTKLASATGPEMEADFESLGPTLPAQEHEPLRRVNTALTGLLAVAESADVAPSLDVLASAERWQAAHKDALAGWKNLLEQVRAGLNPRLEKENLKPLIAK